MITKTQIRGGIDFIMITAREIFKIMKSTERPPRIPFIPTFYEHAARVINKTPTMVARDENLLVESQLKCFDLYDHDLISVGVDIYNVECEALGAEVNYFPASEKIPSIEESLVTNEEDLDTLQIPDPQKDGRMPMFINAADRINKKVGKKVPVNGTITGPFTLAAKMRGFENYIMDLVTNTDFALKLLDFAKKVGLKFAQAFNKKGVGVAINDSWITPPLLSPDLYKEHVFSVQKDMIQEMKNKGINSVALISGGNTNPIAPQLVKTGSSLLIADYNADHSYYKKLCNKNDIFLRANINSEFVESGSQEKMKYAVKEVLKKCSDYYGLIFGCGVVSYDTPVENVLKLKEIFQELEKEYIN